MLLLPVVAACGVGGMSGEGPLKRHALEEWDCCEVRLWAVGGTVDTSIQCRASGEYKCDGIHKDDSGHKF